MLITDLNSGRPTIVETVTASKNISVTHNLEYPPVVLFVPSNTALPTTLLNVVNASDFKSFTYTSAVSLTGTLYIR